MNLKDLRKSPLFQGLSDEELGQLMDMAQPVSLRAGELLITSIDRDGARTGYDLELTAAIADAVDVPVVASGGAGSASDVCDALVRGRADAALVAGILHDGVTTVQHIKREMGRHGIPVRAA